MADYFVDHGAYAAQGVIGAANPTTWGVPQEGDGSATAASSAASTASVQFTANATAASSSISVCGVTFSCVASGATGNQFNVGASLSLSLDALVTAINASTTAVASGVATGTPALKNLIYARKSGTDTLQIMSRVGSATCNNATNSNWSLTTANWTNNGVTNFAGGSGGCWGWFINDVTVGGASATFAAGAFGILSAAKPFVSVANGAPNVQAEPGITDIIYGRSGAGQTITMPTNVGLNATSAMHMNFVLDTNTKWTGDSGTGQVTISFAVSSSTSTGFGINPTTYAKTVGAIGKHKLRIYLRSGATTGYFYIGTGNGSGYTRSKVWNLLFEEAADIAVPSVSFYMLGSGAFHHLYMLGCKFKMPTARSTWPQAVFCTLGLTGTIVFDGVEWECNFTALTDPGALVSGTVSAARAGVRLTNCAISGWSSGKIKPFTISSGAGNASFVVENCTGFRIDSGSYIGFQAVDYVDEFAGRFVFQSADVGLSFRDEHKRGVCDWVYGANYPTLRATQPDGTVWSVKMDWLTTADIVAEALPFRSIPFTQVFREAAATKTVTLECYVPDAITIGALDACMRVSYVSNTTGKMVEEITKGIASGYAASSASWTSNGVASYSAKKFSLTTSEPIKQNTNVTVFLEFHKPAPSSNRQIYVDPEFALT